MGCRARCSDRANSAAGSIRRSITEVTIESEPAQPIETDGDHHPPARLEVSVIPGAVSVLVPT